MNKVENAFIVLIIIVISFTGGCTGMNSVKYQYSDGSGNNYKIGHSGEYSFEYIPVKPEHSSTGEYDGGNPVSKNVTDKDLKNISAVLDAALHNSSIHIQNRVKGSGLIIRNQSGKEIVVVIRPDSEEKSEIEKTLSELMK